MAGKETKFEADRWFTASGLGMDTKTPVSTIRLWTDAGLLDHVRTTTRQTVYPPKARKQVKALRAKRGV